LFFVHRYDVFVIFVTVDKKIAPWHFFALSNRQENMIKMPILAKSGHFLALL